MRNGAYWIWCDIDGRGKRWHLAFTKQSDFGDDDEIVFPLDDFEDVAENYADYPVQAVIAPQGWTGPTDTKIGGAPPSSPQGETPPGMQSAPDGSDKVIVSPSK